MDVTTLGRGGTDATAVALAAALGASCEIYSDVPGVFTADPRIVPGARKLPAVSYEEMLEMSASGAKVLTLRSVELARNHGVRVHARSTFSDEPGTWIRRMPGWRADRLRGDAQRESEVVFTLTGIPDRPGAAATCSSRGRGAVTSTRSSRSRPRRRRVVVLVAVRGRALDTRGDRRPRRARADGVEENHGLGKVSLIGAGMRRIPASPPRCSARLPTSDQPGDDLDVADQDLLHDRP